MKAQADRGPLKAGRRKGAEAAAAGLPESACPYDDKRVLSGRLSWSRAWQRAWLEGHREHTAATAKEPT